MLKDFNLWKKFALTNIARMMEYKEDFVIGIVAMALTNVIAVLFYWVIMQNITALNGWTLGEMLFLFSIETIAWGIWGVLLKGSAPLRIERWVREGSFDRMLVQPIKPLKNVIFFIFDTDGLGDFITGIVILVVSAGMINVLWTLEKVILLSVFIFSGAAIIFSIFLMISTLSFWVTKVHSLAEVIWPLASFTHYPIDVYNTPIKFFLTFITPFAFVGYFPASAFLGKGVWTNLQYLSPIVAIVLVTVACSFWKYGLRHYSSTGT